MSSTADERLPYRDSVFVNFSNGTYQWVHMKLFGLSAELDDPSALACLLESSYYRDGYCGPEARNCGVLHGPYVIEQMRVSDFVATNAADASAELRGWAEYYSKLDEPQREELELHVYSRMGRATTVYRLARLPKDRRADYEINFHFTEFVLLDREAGELALVVGTDD